MSAHALRPSLATALIAGLVVLSSPGALFAAPGSTLTGRVLAGDPQGARPGVVVALVDTDSQAVYRSAPTDDRGAFRVEAPRAGTYAVLVEAPEGAFVASSGVALAPGLNRPVSLALEPGRAGEPPATTSRRSKGGVPTWAKWVIAGGLVVGAAIVVDAVTKSDKEASTFTSK